LLEAKQKVRETTAYPYIPALTRSSTDKAAMEDYRRDEATGFPNRGKYSPDDPSASRTVVFNVSNGLVNGCTVCGQTANTSRCGGCKVVSYCGQEHNSAN
jgi:hypothetical protein